MKFNIPCINCLVFVMCKIRLKDHESVFNPSGCFAWLKGHCSILRDEYYNNKNANPKPVMPYSEQEFCKATLKHFNVQTGRSTHAG